MRFLILILLAYVAYRLVRRFLGPVQHPPDQHTEPSPEGGLIDEMVQDPYCKTYIPKRTAVRRVVAGREYFFCSEACADRFEIEAEAHSEN
ncbi:MAG: YHS domain-containing protein [Deltaproteobacteria bacterium]|nr:YHS domain-containing protein [Deltaproteobacteria bacterium]